MATAEADFGAEPSEELAAQRRARYLAQIRSQGKRLRSGAEILDNRDAQVLFRFYAESFDLIELGRTVALEYGRLRAATEALGRPVPSNDLWIAASATAHGLPLVSLNRRHFEPLTLHGLRLL